MYFVLFNYRCSLNSFNPFGNFRLVCEFVVIIRKVFGNVPRNINSCKKDQFYLSVKYDLIQW